VLNTSGWKTLNSKEVLPKGKTLNSKEVLPKGKTFIQDAMQARKFTLEAEDRNRVFKYTNVLLKTHAKMSSRVTCRLTRRNTRLTAPRSHILTCQLLSYALRVLYITKWQHLHMHVTRISSVQHTKPSDSSSKLTYFRLPNRLGHAVTQLDEALSYKPEDHGFDSRWCH